MGSAAGLDSRADVRTWSHYLGEWRAGRAPQMDGATWLRLVSDTGTQRAMMEAADAMPGARICLIHAAASASPDALTDGPVLETWIHLVAWVGLPTYPRLAGWPEGRRAAVLGALLTRMLELLGAARTRKQVLSLPALLDMVGREVVEVEQDAILMALADTSALDETVLGALGATGRWRQLMATGQVGRLGGTGVGWAAEVSPSLRARLGALLCDVTMPVALRDAGLWPHELDALAGERGHATFRLPLLRWLHLSMVTSGLAWGDLDHDAEEQPLPDVVLELLDEAPARYWPEVRLRDDVGRDARTRWLGRMSDAWFVGLLIEGLGLDLATVTRTADGHTLLGTTFGGDGVSLTTSGPVASARAPLGGAVATGRGFQGHLNAALRGSSDTTAAVLTSSSQAVAKSDASRRAHWAAIRRVLGRLGDVTSEACGEPSVASQGRLRVELTHGDQSVVYIGHGWTLDDAARREGRSLPEARRGVRVLFAVDARRLEDPNVQVPAPAARWGRCKGGRGVFSWAEDGTVLVVEVTGRTST